MATAQCSVDCGERGWRFCPHCGRPLAPRAASPPLPPEDAAHERDSLRQSIRVLKTLVAYRDIPGSEWEWSGRTMPPLKEVVIPADGFARFLVAVGEF